MMISLLSRSSKYFSFVRKNSIRNLSIPASIKYKKNRLPGSWLFNRFFQRKINIHPAIKDSYNWVGCTERIPGAYLEISIHG